MSKRVCMGLLLACLWLAACSNGMEDQPKYEPYEASVFFDNGTSARPLVANTVARGQLQEDRHFYAGQAEGTLATELPFPISGEVLLRGQERYNVYCAPCHGLAGYGDGMIVQRGLTPPPSLHDDRLRSAPVGHIFDVITNGFGVMYSYGDRVAPQDRWAIIAYIQALQLSQNATHDELPPEAQSALENAPAVPEQGGAEGSEESELNTQENSATESDE